MGTRAFAYVREAEDSASVGDAKFGSYAESESINLLAIVRDFPSGSVTDRGMNFAKMLVQLYAGEADTLIVGNLSSFSSDRIEQEVILGHLTRWGIEVRCVEDPELSRDDPDRRLLREFVGKSELVKAIEALRLAGKRKAARTRASGRSEGAKPYGVLAGEDTVLKQINDLNRQRVGATAIARQLNEQGTPTRQGKRWHPTTVANILGARREAAKRKAQRKKAAK